MRIEVIVFIVYGFKHLCYYNTQTWIPVYCFKHQNLLGTPETNLRGLRTRMALRVLRSNPSSSSTELSESPPLSSELRMVMYLSKGDDSLATGSFVDNWLYPFIILTKNVCLLGEWTDNLLLIWWWCENIIYFVHNLN